MSGGSKSVGPTQGELLLTELANQQYKQFTDRFVPVENEFIKRLKDTEGAKRRVLGDVNTEITQQFDAARKFSSTAPRNTGASTGSGKATGMREATTRRESAARSGLRAAASFDVDDRSRQGLTKLVAGATGQKRDALNMLTGAGFNQTSSAIAKAAADQDIRGSRLELAGSLAGAAYYGYGGYQDRRNQRLTELNSSSNWTPFEDPSMADPRDNDPWNSLTTFDLPNLRT